MMPLPPAEGSLKVVSILYLQGTRGQAEVCCYTALHVTCILITQPTRSNI